MRLRLLLGRTGSPGTHRGYRVCRQSTSGIVSLIWRGNHLLKRQIIINGASFMIVICSTRPYLLNLILRSAESCESNRDEAVMVTSKGEHASAEASTQTIGC